MKGNGRFHNRCKQVGHIEQYCKNKNKNTNVSSIKFDSCYLLTKSANGVKAKFVPANGVKAKFVCTSMLGPKKRPFGYQRAL